MSRRQRSPKKKDEEGGQSSSRAGRRRHDRNKNNSNSRSPMRRERQRNQDRPIARRGGRPPPRRLRRAGGREGGGGPFLAAPRPRIWRLAAAALLLPAPALAAAGAAAAAGASGPRRPPPPLSSPPLPFASRARGTPARDGGSGGGGGGGGTGGGGGGTARILPLPREPFLVLRGGGSPPGAAAAGPSPPPPQREGGAAAPLSPSSQLATTDANASSTGTTAATAAAAAAAAAAAGAVASSPDDDDAADDVPAWKRAFPEPLRKKRRTFQKLELGGVQIYLLGTAHVSSGSSRDVRALLEVAAPDCVFAELCEARIPLLLAPPEDGAGEAPGRGTNATRGQPEGRGGNGNKSKRESVWRRAAALRRAEERDGEAGGTSTATTSRLQALSAVLLASVQEGYARDLGVELGGEFRAAYRYWRSRRRREDEEEDDGGSGRRRPPVHFVLGDRPVHLTLRRAWESLRWWPKARLVAGLAWSCLVRPDPDEVRRWLEQVLGEETDVLTKSFDEMRRHFPSLHASVVAERDAYMAAKITQACRHLAPGSVMVAVVGAGHVQGIVNWLVSTNATQTPEQLIEGLVTTAQRRKRPRKGHGGRGVDTDSDGGCDGDDPDLVRHWIHEVTVLQEMPDESFAWAQPQVE